MGAKKALRPGAAPGVPAGRPQVPPLAPAAAVATCGALSARILKHTLDGYRGVTQLLGEVKKSTLYRHIRKLCGLGYLKRKGDEYRTTQVGKVALLGGAGTQAGSVANGTAIPPGGEPGTQQIILLDPDALYQRWRKTHGLK